MISDLSGNVCCLWKVMVGDRWRLAEPYEVCTTARQFICLPGAVEAARSSRKGCILSKGLKVLHVTSVPSLHYQGV